MSILYAGDSLCHTVGRQLADDLSQVISVGHSTDAAIAPVPIHDPRHQAVRLRRNQVCVTIGHPHYDSDWHVDIAATAMQRAGLDGDDTCQIVLAHALRGRRSGVLHALILTRSCVGALHDDLFIAAPPRAAPLAPDTS
jgi:hypothetical protein